MYYAEGTLVRGNDLRGNKAGIELTVSSNNRIESNNVSNSEGNGIAASDLSMSNQIIGNISNDNQGAGISVNGEVPGDSGTLIEGNQTHNNDSYGIHVPKPSHIVRNNSANENARAMVGIASTAAATAPRTTWVRSIPSHCSPCSATTSCVPVVMRHRTRSRLIL
jgi:parallel beta-helix repeat protein